MRRALWDEGGGELVRLSRSAPARDRIKATGIDAPPVGVTVVEGDIHDGRSPEELVDGANACIHLIGILREQRNGVTFHRMHVAATRLIVDACRGGGVSRYLHMSALGVGDNGICDYQTASGRPSNTSGRSGLDWTIFRRGADPRAEQRVRQDGIALGQGEAQPWFFMPYFTRGVEEKGVPLGGLTR